MSNQSKQHFAECTAYRHGFVRSCDMIRETSANVLSFKYRSYGVQAIVVGDLGIKHIY